ncbi:MAG: oligosaccharide flippase family protein [Thermodesulfobacteriota bacterium]
MAEDAIKRVAKNLVSLLSVRVFDVLYTFLVMAILARYFGPRLYGDYAFVVALVFIYLPIINFGITPIMVRELSVHPDRRDEIFGAGLAFRLLLAAVAVVGTAVVLPLVSLSHRLGVALVICLVSELCLLGVRTCAEIFITFEKMELETYLTMTNRVLALILLLAIAYFDLGFLAVFIAFAAINGVALLVALLIVKAQFLTPRLVWDGHLLWFWVKEALPLAISFIFLESFLRVDIILLRVFRNPVEIAYFDVAYKIIYRILLVASVLAIVLSPALFRLGQREAERFRSLVEQGLKILLILVIPITMVAHLLGPHLMVPCFGSKFQPSELAMAILSWCLLFAFFEPFLTGVLIGIKKAWIVPFTNGSILVVNLLLDVVLIPSYGYLGACYANIGAYGLWFILSLIVSHRVMGGFSLTRVGSRVLPVGLAVAVPLLAWHHLNPWSNPGAWSPLLITITEVAVALIFYGALLWVFKAITWQEIVALRETLGKPHKSAPPQEQGSPAR